MNKPNDYGRLVKDPEALQAFLDHAFCDDARRRVLMVVGNRIAGDSRVLKSAHSLAERGLEVMLVGLRPLPNDFSHGYIEGIPYLLVNGAELSTGADEAGHVAAVRTIGERLARGLAGTRFAILYTHDYWGLALGLHLMQGCGFRQSLYWVHDVHEYIKGYEGILPAGRLAYAIDAERRMLALPDQLVFVNERIAALLATEFGIDERSCLIVHNAPRTQRACDFDLRRAIGLDEGVPLGVYLGRATPARGLDILIPALVEIPELHFALLSSAAADYLAELKALAETAAVADRLHVFPYVADSEVAAAVASASFGISPLTRYGNSDLAVPTKVLEFIHAELTMVVSDATFQADFVRLHGLGEVFAAREPASFVAAVRAVLARCETPDWSALKRYAPDWQALKSEYSWDGQFGAVVRAIEAYLENGRIAARGVFQGPGNPAGQPALLARSLRALSEPAQAIDSIAAEATAAPDADGCWPASGLHAQAALAQWASSRFSVLHLHGQPFIAAADPAAAFQDLSVARQRGCRIVFQFHGNEVRTPAALRASNPFAWEIDAVAKRNAEALITAARACADLILVSNPELRTYIPEARVLPVAVDLDKLPFVGAKRRTRPRIVAQAAETSLGGQALAAACAALQRDGLEFDFVALETMEPEAIGAELADADIVVDQLVVGWYGPLGVEAMARGKAVVAFIRDDLVEELTPGVLVNANPRTLAARLSEIVVDADRRVALGNAARSHVEQQHASGVVAARLRQMYREIEAQPARDAWPELFGAAIDNALRIGEQALQLVNLEAQLQQALKARPADTPKPAVAAKPAVPAKPVVAAKPPAAAAAPVSPAPAAVADAPVKPAVPAKAVVAAKPPAAAAPSVSPESVLAADATVKPAAPAKAVVAAKPPAAAAPSVSPESVAVADTSPGAPTGSKPAAQVKAAATNGAAADSTPGQHESRIASLEAQLQQALKANRKKALRLASLEAQLQGTPAAVVQSKTNGAASPAGSALPAAASAPAGAPKRSEGSDPAAGARPAATSAAIVATNGQANPKAPAAPRPATPGTVSPKLPAAARPPRSLGERIAHMSLAKAANRIQRIFNGH